MRVQVATGVARAGEDEATDTHKIKDDYSAFLDMHQSL